MDETESKSSSPKLKIKCGAIVSNRITDDTPVDHKSEYENSSTDWRPSGVKCEVSLVKGHGC